MSEPFKTCEFCGAHLDPEERCDCQEEPAFHIGIDLANGVDQTVLLNGCSCAMPTDEWHGWECSISGGACMFFVPNARKCAEQYGEGPLSENAPTGAESEDEANA